MVIGLLLASVALMLHLTAMFKLRTLQRSIHVTSSLPDIARELENLFTMLISAQQKLEMSHRHGLHLSVTICQQVNHSVLGLQRLVDQLHRLAGIPRLFQVHPVVDRSAMARSLRIQQAYEMM